VVAGAAAVAIAAGAQASISDPVIHVHASNAQGAGDFDVPLASGTFNADGSYIFFLPAPVNITSGPNVIATITQMSTFIRPASGTQPNLISFGFAVQSGGGAGTPTVFTMDTAFFDIGPALSVARTSAGIGVTDTDGDGVGFQGVEPGDGAYITQYNHGSTFATLIHGLVANPNPDGSAHADDTNPGGGLYSPIGVANNMNAEWAFFLTPNDTAGGTSAWEILPVPGPGAITLIGLGGLAAFRRSRR